MLILPILKEKMPVADTASEALSKVAYSSYWRQLSSVRPPPVGMLICDASGRVVWSNTEMQADARNSAALLLERALEGACLRNLASVNQINGGNYLVRTAPVCTGAGDLVGLIGVVLSFRPATEAPRADELDQILGGIAESVAREGDLIRELNAMATELAFRYEELNLLYNIADDKEIEQSECERTLRELLRACGSHLESDVAAIILPQQNILSYYTSDPGLLDESRSPIQILSNEVYPWIVANRRQLVFNKSDEPLCVKVCPGLAGKLMACPVLNELGNAYGIIAVLRPDTAPDFTTSDRRLLEVVATKAEKVLQLSFDALTGLMNRNEFLRILDKSLATAHSRGSQYCLLVVEIDHLKIINDAFGHEAGDALLRYVAGVFRAQFDQDKSVISRIGGDHFAVLMPSRSLADGRGVAKTLAKVIGSTPFSWRESRRNITVSIGLAAMDRRVQRAKTALYAAEIACDAARELNTDRVAIYNEDDPVFLEKREDIRWIGQIQDALASDRFTLYCQKIECVSKASPNIVYHEILLRLKDGSENLFSPAQFLPAAERYYLMPQIDRWVLRTLFKSLSSMNGRYVQDAHLWSVNLSGQTLSDDGFLHFVTDQLSTYGISPTSICFEITETAAVANIDRAQRLIDGLRSFGCWFSLDDFGTGLSSFGYLKSLQIDHLKIDGSFIRDILQNKTSEAVVSSIIHLGHVLGVKVIAEWVEDSSIRETLERLGIDFVQGFGVGRPLAIEEWFRARHNED